MPNWCSNEVSISGSREIISEILEITEKNPEKFQMSDFVPMPKELEGTNAPSDSPNWYDWCNSNWGTKWDMCDVYQSNHPSKASMTISFNTAWAPNVQFWAKFSELYPTLSIIHYYYEEGMGFIGEAIYENGLVDDYCIDISNEIWEKAGAVFNSEGYVDWDNSDVCLFDVFPLRHEMEIENV